MCFSAQLTLNHGSSRAQMTLVWREENHELIPTDSTSPDQRTDNGLTSAVNIDVEVLDVAAEAGGLLEQIQFSRTVKKLENTAQLDSVIAHVRSFVNSCLTYLLMEIALG